MPLKDGVIYKDGRGRERTVMGATNHHEGYVWTLQGDWYDRATGKKVFYGKKADGTWHYYLHDKELSEDLQC